jgi:hypothetical protein
MLIVYEDAYKIQEARIAHVGPPDRRTHSLKLRAYFILFKGYFTTLYKSRGPQFDSRRFQTF